MRFGRNRIVFIGSKSMKKYEIWALLHIFIWGTKEKFLSLRINHKEKDMEKLLAREKEIEELRKAYTSDKSEFVVILGRRRIGKTFLVHRFFNDLFDFHYTGVRNMTLSQQLENFAIELQEYGGSAFNTMLKDWFDAFRHLRLLVEQKNRRKRKVVFIDEMPWVDTRNSTFITAFENFWNGWANMHGDIVFVACGSSTSWMTNKLEDNQGGLHNRITSRVFLHPFNLRECEEYLHAHGCIWERYDILRCHMILGGVPYYLSLLDPQLSLVQNIDRLFFQKSPVLYGEFDELYNALFSNAESYISIVRTLSEKNSGMTRQEISDKTKLSGGRLTRMLINLEQSDFINVYQNFKSKKKGLSYRLSDFFTLFYFKFIENQRSNDEYFWAHRQNTPGINSWQGYTFEQICLSHLEQIKEELGISGMATSASTWRSNNKQQGAQIDLIIDRADRVINLCEIKFSQEPYVITKEYAQKVRNRAALFREESRTKKSFVITFITTFGIAQNIHAGLAQNELTAEALFR